VIAYRHPRHVWAKDMERLRAALRSRSRSRLYPVLGVGLALAAPIGLVVVRALAAGEVPTLAWALEDFRHLPVTYSYVASSTVVAFAILGYLLGRSFDRVRHLSITDPLTGLFNRRHYGHRVAEELARARRGHRATCMLCVDIDRLKMINDAFGHKAGDRAIIAISRILAKSVRAVDTVARVGGDEFAVLLPETSATHAVVLSQRILNEVARHSDELTGGLAVSIGITELDATAEATQEALFAAGDAALYRVKGAGGGHAAVALAVPPPTCPSGLSRPGHPRPSRPPPGSVGAR
jgi:diguanylate cyclase (GGDEF)-like protein